MHFKIADTKVLNLNNPSRLRLTYYQLNQNALIQYIGIVTTEVSTYVSRLEYEPDTNTYQIVASSVIGRTRPGFDFILILVPR